MDDFLPSEVARLVLGYLKEVNCIKSWETFLGESPSLQEYYYLYANGRVYCTNVDEKSLLEILSVYRSLKKYGDKIVNEIKRCEKEYNSNPDTRQDIIDEIANMVSLTFQKYLPLNIGNIMSVPTSDMTTAIFSEAQGNIYDDPASKSTFGNNLTAYTSQSDSAETNTFSEASENTDSTYEMPHISEVYSLSNVNNNSLSSYNRNDFNTPTTDSVKSSPETLHIDLTKDKCLEKFKISNTEVGNSNVKDSSSHMGNESQACCAMSKDLSVHSNESVKDHVLEKYDSDLIPASSANVETKDTSSVEMSRADSLGNDNKLAEPVLSNSDDIESSRDIKPDLNSLNLLIQNSEKNEGLSDSPSNNSLSKPNADVYGNNNLELDRDLPYNNQSIDREVPNFENKLDSSTNGENFVTATSSYQFPTIPTVPTYILTGNVLMPNTFPYNYVISTPFSNMSLPVSSISYNIQNTNIATTDTSKSEENMPVPPNPVSESVLTLPDGQLDNKSSSEENTLNTPNSISENILTLVDGQLENKSNSIDKNGCKDKNESSFKTSNIKTYEGRKRKTGGLDKHPCSKRVSKRKLVVEKCMSPSCTSEQNKGMQVEETPTVSEPAVSALQLLSLITGQKEYDDGPDPATENKTKNESQMMHIKSENVIDISEENVTQSCSAKEILKKIDALNSNDKLNESQKQIDGNFVSKNIEFQYKSHENEFFSSHQINEVDIKDRESNKVDNKSHGNESGIYTDYKLQNMPCVILTQLDEYEIQKNELLSSLAHEESVKKQSNNSKVKMQKNNKLKPKSCGNESFSSGQTHDIKDQDNIRKVKSQKTNKLEDEYHENESFSNHQTHDNNDQNSIRKVKSQKTNKLEDVCHENASFSDHQTHDVKDQNSIRKVKSQKTNKLEDEYHENESFSSHQTHEVHIKNQNSDSKVKSQENSKSKCKSQENKSFSSYEVDIKDKNSNSKSKSQKTNKLKDESHENKSFSNHKTHEVYIKNQNSNSEVKPLENKSKYKTQESKSFSSYEVDIKDKNRNSKVKSQKTNKLKDEFHENKSFSNHQTDELHIKNQNSNSKLKTQENDKSICKTYENRSFSSYEVVKDKNSNSKIKSQKTNKLKDESHENKSFSSHQTHELHIKNQNSNSKVKSQENNKSKCKSRENKSFSSQEVDIKDQNSNNKVKSQKVNKLKNEYFRIHQTHEVHIKNQDGNTKVKSLENNKLKRKSHEKEYFSSHEIDIKDQNSNNEVKSQKGKKLKDESCKNEFFRSHQTSEAHIKDQNANNKVKSRKSNKVKHESYKNESLSSYQAHEIDANDSNTNSKVESEKNKKLKHELHENESFSSHQTSEVHIKDQNVNNKVKSRKSNKLKHESYKNESLSSHQTHEIDANDSNSNSKVESEKNKKLKHELHENESFSSHQINEVDIKDQNSDSNVKSEENTMIQVYDKVKKLPKQKEAVQNCKETNNLKKLDKKQSEDQNILPGVSEELAENKNDASQKEKQGKIIKTESCQKSIKCQKGESASSLNCNRALRSKISCKLYEIESNKNIKLKHELHEKESFSSHQINEGDIKDKNSEGKVKSLENTMIQVYDKDKKSPKQKEAVQNCKETDNLKKMNNKQSEDQNIVPGVSEELAEDKNGASQKEKQGKIIKTELYQKSIKCQKGESASSLNCNRALRSKISCKLYEIESHKNIKLKHELHEKESFSSHQINEGDIKDQNSDSKVKSLENTMIQVYDKDKKSPKQKEAVQNCKETDNLKKMNNKQSEDQNILPGVSEELAENKNDASQKEKQGKIIKTESCQKSIKCQKGESASSLNCNRALRSKISCKLYEIESHKNIKLKHELHEKESFSSHQINEGDIKDQNSDSKVKSLENTMIQVYDKDKKSPKQKEAVQNCKETDNLKKMNNKQSEDQNILPGVSEELAENKNDASQKEKQGKIIKTESCQKSIKCQKGESASSLNCNRALRSKISCKLYEIESHKNIKLKHELHEKESFSSHQINEGDIKDQNSDSKVKSLENTMIQVYDKDKKSPKQKEAVQNCKETNNLKKMNNKQSEDQNILPGVSEELAENKNDASQKEKQGKIIKTESCQKSIKCQKGESASSLNCNRTLRSKISCKLYEIESHKNIKLKNELHEKESFSSHQINEGDIKDQNSDSEVKSLENTMIQVYDKDKKSLKQKKAVQNCKETNNLKKLDKKQSEDQNILPGASGEVEEEKNDAHLKKKHGKIIKTESYQKSIKCQKGESASSLDCNRALRSKISCKLYEIESHKNIKCEKSKNRPNCNRLLLPKISLQKITIHSMEQNVKNSSSKKFSSIDQNKSFIHNEDNYLKASNKYERLNYFRMFRNSNIVQEKSDHEQYSCNLSLDLSSVSSLEDQYPKTLNYTEKDCSLKETGNPELLSHSSFESPSIDQESTRSATLVISTDLILQNGIDTSSSSNEFNSEAFPSLTQTEGLVFQIKPTVQNLVQNAAMLNCNANYSLSNGFNSKVFPSLTQTENLVVQAKPVVQNFVQNAVMLNCNGNGSLSNEFNSKVFPSLTQTENLVVQAKPAVQNFVQKAVMLNCNGNGSSSNEFNSKVFPSLTQTEDLVFQTKRAAQNLVQNAVMLNCNGNGSLSNEFNSKVFPSLIQTENLVLQAKPAVQNLVQNAVMLNCNGNGSLSNEFNSKVFPSLTQTEGLVFQTKPPLQNLVQNAVMLNCNGNDSLSNEFNSKVFPLIQTENLVVQAKPAVQNLEQNTQMLNCNEDSKKCGNLPLVINTEKENNSILITDARQVLSSSQNDFINIKEGAKKIKLRKCSRTKKINDKFPSRRLIIKKTVSSYSGIIIHSQDICKSIKDLSLHNVSKKISVSGSNVSTKIPEVCSVSENDSNGVNEAGLQNNSGRKRKLENSCDVSNRLEFDSKITQFSDCNSSKRAKQENCVEPVLSSDSGLSESLYKNTKFNNEVIQLSNCDSSKSIKKQNCLEPSLSLDSGLSKYLCRSKTECIGMQKNHKQSFHSSFLSENTVNKEVAGKNILCSNHIYKDSKCPNMPCVTLTKSDEHGVHSLPHKLDHNIEEKNADCRNHFEQTTKTVSEGNAKMLSQNPDGSILSQYLCRSKMECIGMQKNHKQSFHSSFLSENTVKKEVAGKNILCSNHNYKDSKCQNMPCVTLTKLDEHGVHSLSHTLDHNIEEKNADCRNHFEQTTKTVSEGNAKMLSQNPDGSILSYSLKVSVNNLNNICDNNRKETVETNMETSGKKNNDVSLAFTSCEKQLVKSQSNNTSSHLPKNTCSIDTVCDNNSASLETRTKNPIVSTEDESNSSRKVPPQWDIIQGAIEKYGCDYILSKINHYLNC